MTNIKDFLSFKDIFTILSSLNLEIYTPTKYILAEKKEYYEEKYDTQLSNKTSLKQSTRETGIMKLMRVNLLKRLESSVVSFRITLGKLNTNISLTLKSIDAFKKGGKSEIEAVNVGGDDEFDEEQDMDEFSIGTKIRINLADMDVISWERELRKDNEVITKLLGELQKITPEKDSKLNNLIGVIENKITHPINRNNKKVVVFSAFADTTHYLYEHVSKYFLSKYKINSASISGTRTNQTTLNTNRKEMDTLLTYFSPISKKRDELGLEKFDIDILIATDCISEGQNLQDCDYLINYDIHWNPVRIIQRFGRIDRLGSLNESIQLFNYWPPVDLDEYIKLKSRVHGRMGGVNITAGGEDSVISEDDIIDLEYRKNQLSKLKNEVVELEDVGNSISITDLGLNDFRIDLINYYKEKGEIKNVAFGLHAVANKTESFPAGVIFVLKNLNKGVNINNINRLHPFYLIYVKESGDVYSNHIDVKKVLDIFRALSKNKDEPNYTLCELFNEETKDGSEMKKYSGLLHKSIESIINVKEDQDLNSLFKSGGTSIGLGEIKGINDFELVSFLVIK